MPHVHVSVGEDETTLLTVFVRGLNVDLDVASGSTVDFARNRAIDQLWAKVPFCHGATAMSTLRLFDAGTKRELQDNEPVEDGMHFVMAAETPREGVQTSGAAAYADVASSFMKGKLGSAVEEVKAKSGVAPRSREELQRLSVKDLRKVIEDAGASSAGCVEKADLVEAAIRATGGS
mmetsp:Transcript_111353/g.237900  ORF Transcript_111353/g.237900 Transcript_111353/m.237900 type:complete len:177 (-) Transcript_111353:34-564(-)